MRNVKITTEIHSVLSLYFCPDFTYGFRLLPHYGYRITAACNCVNAVCGAFPGAFRLMQRVACDTNEGFQTSDLPRSIQVWGP